MDSLLIDAAILEYEADNPSGMAIDTLSIGLDGKPFKTGWTGI